MRRGLDAFTGCPRYLCGHPVHLTPYPIFRKDESKSTPYILKSTPYTALLDAIFHLLPDVMHLILRFTRHRVFEICECYMRDQSIFANFICQDVVTIKL